MQVDWLSILKGQQEVAQELGFAVKDQLAKPDLTEKEVAKLQNQVEIGSAAYDALLKALSQRVVDEAFFFTAAALSQFWVELSRTVEKRRREITTGKTKTDHRSY